MKYWVYVIESEEGYRYTGQTDDLMRRLDEHNSGVTQSTRRGKKWRVIYEEEYGSRSEAMKREKYLKTSAGRRYPSYWSY